MTMHRGAAFVSKEPIAATENEMSGLLLCAIHNSSPHSRCACRSSLSVPGSSPSSAANVNSSLEQGIGDLWCSGIP